jgi:transketolase
MTNNLNESELIEFAKRVRLNILKMSTNGGCFTGAAMSLVEIVTTLYNNFLNINSETLNSTNRDYLFISKGHAVPVLYAAFAELNWFDPARLNNHLKVQDDIYWHPNTNIPGIEFHSGSLGHALSVGVGAAKSLKIDGLSSRVVVILGDGELNEGSNWEALLIASSMKLDNLTIIIDRNKLQANILTEALVPLEPLIDKFIAFGCGVRRINGHDFSEILHTLSELPFEFSRPNVLIADTIRGKGIGPIEAKPDKWFCNFTYDEVTGYKKEILNS